MVQKDKTPPTMVPASATGMVVPVPAVPLLIQLPPNASGKAAEDGLRASALSHMWDIWMESLAPALPWYSLGYWGHWGNESEDGRSPCRSLRLANKYI